MSLHYRASPTVFPAEAGIHTSLGNRTFMYYHRFNEREGIREASQEVRPQESSGIQL